VADDLCRLDATALAARIRDKEVSPVEVLRAHEDRIGRLNPLLNAIVTSAPDAAERARAAEAAVMRGERLGPLHGVPFTMKDAFETAGLRTACGSRLLAHHVPATDATVVTRMRAAGGVMLGKTNVPEFCLWGETSNLVFGRTVNPWNRERTCGGSSGGEAAAIAAGCSPIGVGSDVGGSIRLPAHYCGIVGFKPSHGRVSTAGYLPATLFRFNHAGPMARTVRDVALGTHVLAGPDGRDPYCLAVPAPEVAASLAAPGPLRVGWIAARGFGPVHEEIVTTVARAAAALQDAGCHVEATSVPALERIDAHALTVVLFGAEGAPYFDALIGDRRDELHPFLRRRLDTRITSLSDYVAAEHEVDRLRQGLVDYFTRFDVLLCPTGTVPAHGHDATEHVIAGQTVVARHALRATLPFDLTGSPALSVPFAWSAEGLPLGVQVVGRHLDDVTVLRVGALLESRAERRTLPAMEKESPPDLN
jgi:aspartyl-tRNA(Asn)/glutamyl-tRNA(Gln) amidotransferase subunit A